MIKQKIKDTIINLLVVLRDLGSFDQKGLQEITGLIDKYFKK